MKSGKDARVRRNHDTSSPASPVRKRVKLEISRPQLPPKLPKEQKERSTTVQEQTEDGEIEQSCPEETAPQILNTNPQGNVTENWTKDSKFNVLEIPEYSRLNFGIPDFWRLDDCKIGKGFWYQKRFLDHVKYFIALHNDQSAGTHWDTTRQFTVKQQIGLQIPETFKLSFRDILKKIGDDHKKAWKTPPRVWLDVRDFSILFSAEVNGGKGKGNPMATLKAIEELVTHFSFGGRLYSEMRMAEEELLGFILQHFKHVEYLCLQDDMLRTKSSASEIRLESHVQKSSLPKLETIRLVHSRSVFSVQFILELVGKCPKLLNMFGMPLHLLKHVDRKLKDKGKEKSGRGEEVADGSAFKSSIRSVYTSRNHYAPYRAAPYFLEDISVFCGKGKRALYEWSTRSFFIYNFYTRGKCCEIMSNALKENADTLQKLAIEPPFENRDGKMCRVHFPVLKKCTSLQVHMMRQHQMAHPFFPTDFDPAKKLPNLTHVEITVDKRSITENSRPYPTYGKRSLWSLFDEHFPAHVLQSGFASVRVLALLHFSPYEVMPRMAELFPNLRVLRLANGLVDIVTVLHLCYKHWPKLQQLILEINNDTKFGNLDAGFTGIPQDTLKTLVHTIDPASEDALAIVQKNRVKLPISHLKDLQLLKIVLRSSGFGGSNLPPIFTPFSIFFGFDRKNMPNVKIQICFSDRVTNTEKQKMSESLESVLQYIELED